MPIIAVAIGVAIAVAVAMPVIAMAAGVAVVRALIALAVSVAVPGRAASSARATVGRPAGASCAGTTAATGASGSCRAAVCHAAAGRTAANPACGSRARTQGTRHARRAAADRAGYRVIPIRIVEIVHPAEGLGPNGTAAGFLTLHDAKPAAVIHGGICDCRNALLSNPRGLGIGGRSKREEEGSAGPRKSG